MKVAVTGLNHRTAPLAVREQFAFDHGALPFALKQLTDRPGLKEGLILSTCNRVEIAVSVDDQVEAWRAVEEFLAAAKHVERQTVHPYLYHYEGREAARHLFRVAASLDSMVVGEPQILGQLKSAYALAKAEGALSGQLESLLTRAFSVAKRVRSETEIGANAVSISYAAVEFARKLFGSLANRKVMIVGAGKMSELTARHLRRSGVTQVSVTNRTAARAQAMAALFGGNVVPYDRMLQALPEMDIVITSSAAPEPILRKEEMRRVIEARRNRPMFLIDIAVPRNVEAAVNDLEGVFLYDIDDLQKVVDSNLQSRVSEAEQADVIIDEEVERLESYLRTREVTPTIISLQEQLEEMRRSEVQRMRAKLGALTPAQEEAVEALTRSMMNKIAHGPISELRRQAAQPDSTAPVDVIRRIFRLGE